MRQRPYRYEPNGERLPMASLKVWKPGSTWNAVDCQVDGLLDTGSASTFVPRDVAEKQKLAVVCRRRVPFLSGQGDDFKVCVADIEIFDVVLQNRHVLIFNNDEPEALVGRDVLDHFAVIFDGLNKRWHVVADGAEPRLEEKTCDDGSS